MVLPGSARDTRDLDICYARDRESLARLAACLAPLHPRLRGAPDHLPFRLDAPTLAAGMNFTLVTDLGDLNLLGEMAGIGGYDQLARLTIPMVAHSHEIAVPGLDSLERNKRASGRLQDLLDIAEIAEIRRQCGEGKGN